MNLTIRPVWSDNSAGAWSVADTPFGIWRVGRRMHLWMLSAEDLASRQLLDRHGLLRQTFERRSDALAQLATALELEAACAA